MKRRNKPKRNLAYDIAEAIQSGEFRPGEWLRQIDLEQKFGATRFDVRAGLEELAIRKSIQHVPNRGYRVAVPDEVTLAFISKVRVLLECAAAPGILAGVDDQSFRRLKDLAKSFTQAIKDGTQLDQSRTNRDFHRLLYSLCGNPILEELIWSLRERSRASSTTIWRSHQAILKADREHYAILDALNRRAPKRLAQVIAGHIDRDRK